MEKTFNFVNYKRMERYNNYANFLSMVLFALALATIPVTFVSLEAARDGEE